MRAVVQLRGEVNVAEDVEDTLSMLNLHAVNHCTLVPDRDSYRGMVTKVNDVVAHGEPSAETVATLLRTRGEPVEGDADIDDAWVESNTDYGSVDELATALAGDETALQEQGLAPVLRLHPPRSGHDGLKQSRAEGGQLGKHTTEEIDALLEAMR
ncbi:50S ribosomal protein L30 [Halobacteriales archaeon SW_7_68_16]|nr:MAG: 50S ribosomal protein L30 [Halobacteriales archaeon SW_7_68_16]